MKNDLSKLADRGWFDTRDDRGWIGVGTETTEDIDEAMERLLRNHWRRSRGINRISIVRPSKWSNPSN